MSRIDRNDPNIQEVLSIKGLTAAAILDISAFDMHAEIAQAALG